MKRAWHARGAALTPLGLPHDASTEGHSVDALLRSTGYLLAFFVVTLAAWLLWCAISRRRRAAATRSSSALAAGVTLAVAVAMFVVIDGHLLARAMLEPGAPFADFHALERDPAAVTIEINAHQWAWDVRYPGPDGKFDTPDDVVALNEIRVPVGAPVLVQLASTDVVHSFYLPNFRIKTDAIPGSISRLSFRARETGTFEVACAQHCGVNHYKMRAELTVSSAEDYQRWYRAASDRAARAYDASDSEAHWGWPWAPTN